MAGKAGKNSSEKNAFVRCSCGGRIFVGVVKYLENEQEFLPKINATCDKCNSLFDVLGYGKDVVYLAELIDSYFEGRLEADTQLRTE